MQLWTNKFIKSPQTWDEFVEDCKLLKETGIEPYVDDSENVHNLPMDLYYSGVIGQDRDSDKEINDGDSTFEEKYTDTFETWYADMVESGLFDGTVSDCCDGTSAC